MSKSKIKIYLVSLMLLITGGLSTAYADVSVGFKQTVLYNESIRPLKTTIWYPSKTKLPLERVADNPAFLGTDLVRLGTPLRGDFPVVVISHGYRGNWKNQNWLATKLAKQGFIVATLDHPGTTSFDHSPHFAAQWWERPKDISRLLDWLLEISDLTPFIDPTNITAIGHSLGAWTVMALAGAEFDREQLIQECQVKDNPRTCGLMPELGLDKFQKGEAKSSLKDVRIKRVVSLDVGLARSFLRQSLTELTTPILILGADVDIGDLPQVEESGFLAQHIPKSIQQYIIYSDAAHFSFMQLCKAGAVELLEEEVLGDGIVCKDGGGRSRKALHQIIYQDILAFISKN